MHKEPRLLTLGENIKSVRKQKNISQEKLAELSMTDRSYMGRIERGEKNVTILKLWQLADALEVEVKDFFETN